MAALILQWPSRRSLVFASIASYLFWIALVHHQASLWIRTDVVAVADVLAVAELIAPFEKFGGPPATWRSLVVEGRKMHYDGEFQGTPTEDWRAKETQPIDSSVAIPDAQSDYLAGETRQDTETLMITERPFASFMESAPECYPLKANEVTITLVTQCDDARIEMAAQHCLRWSGPIAIAVHSTRTADDIMSDLVTLGCIRDQLRVNKMNPSASLPHGSYPVNHLRNLALNSVETTHIVYMDIDFLPSKDLESTLFSEPIRQTLETDIKHALVIPAFEFKPTCHNCSTQRELLARMPSTKEELMMLHDTGEASMFHEYWPVAHDSTDYTMWKHQEHGSLIDISCIKSNHYEPYLILRRCAEMPPFQEAFTGYGYNKASFTMQLQAMQYRFSQIGGVFCTHFPHPASKDRRLFDKDKKAKVGRRLAIAELVKNFTRWLDETYGHNKPRVPSCQEGLQARSDQAPKTITEVGHVSPMFSSPVNESNVFLETSLDLDVCNDVNPEEISFSLVLQCSDDRLWMMEHHCMRWAVDNATPLISLVVYTNDTILEIKDKLRSLGCPVDFGMTVQIFSRIYEDKDYPVNYFRNKALDAVNTTHAVFLDVDFWASTNLFSTLNGISVRTKLSESPQHALVVPAFQLLSQCKEKYADCPEKHIPMMPLVKDDQMESNLKDGDITVFNIIHNRDGHGSTRYDVWMDQSADDLLEIECVKSNRYEPYLVVRVCQDLPPFQPVFTGYGKNKISWILHLRRLGYRLFQIGEAFVIHYPHKDSKAKLAWKGGSVRGARLLHGSNDTSGEESMRRQNDKHFVDFRQWLAQAVPNRTKVFKCVHGGISQDDDAALWVARDDSKPVAF